MKFKVVCVVVCVVLVFFFDIVCFSLCIVFCSFFWFVSGDRLFIDNLYFIVFLLVLIWVCSFFMFVVCRVLILVKFFVWVLDKLSVLV